MQLILTVQVLKNIWCRMEKVDSGGRKRKGEKNFRQNQMMGEMEKETLHRNSEDSTSSHKM